MDYRKMRAYELARDFYVAVAQHSRRPGWRDNALMDQLMRASSSICLNIAEGAGEYSRAEKNRFYRIARRSAWESSSAVDLISQMTHCPELVESSMKLDQVSALLTTMILRSEQGEGEGQGQRPMEFPAAVNPLIGLWPSPWPLPPLIR